VFLMLLLLVKSNPAKLVLFFCCGNCFLFKDLFITAFYDRPDSRCINFCAADTGFFSLYAETQ
jgi:hypothetical protein